MNRELAGQFGFPRRAEIVECFGPGLEPRRFNDRMQSLAKVDVAAPFRRDHLRPGGQLCGLFQERPQLGENRHVPEGLALMMLGLWGMDTEAILTPIDIFPFQRQMFRGTAQAAEPAQGEDQPPFGIGTGRQNFGRHVAGDEKVATAVFRHPAFDRGERIVAEPRLDDGNIKKLLCPAADAPRCVQAQAGARKIVRLFWLGAHQVSRKTFRLGLGHLAHVLRFTKKIGQEMSGAFEIDNRSLFGVGPLGDVSLAECPDGQIDRFGPANQPGASELDQRLLWQTGQPLAGFGIGRRALDPDGREIFDPGFENGRIAELGLAEPDTEPAAMDAVEFDALPTVLVVDNTRHSLTL